MKILRYLLLVLLSIIIPLSAFSDKADKKEELIYFDKKFYYNLKRIPAIQRDDFLNDKINKIIRGRGVVQSIDKVKRYRRQFRVTLLDQDAAKYKLTIKFYIFISNEDSIKLLTKGEIFEFKGQFMASTPVNTWRNSYIFDIALEKGALLVK